MRFVSSGAGYTPAATYCPSGWIQMGATGPFPYPRRNVGPPDGLEPYAPYLIKHLVLRFLANCD